MKSRFSLFIAVSVFMLIGFSSCVREYTCQCGIKYTGQPGLPDSTTNSYTIKDTKKKAKAACESHSGEYQNGNIKTVENCMLY